MKRLLTFTAIAASLALTAPVSHAAVGSATFTVNATLASACTMSTFSGNIDFGTVTAFVAPSDPAAITSTVTCTRTLTGVTAVFDAVGGSTTSSGAGTSITGTGLLSNGLKYDLTGSLGSFTAGTAASTGSVGTGETATFTVNSSMAAQAGTCTSGTCAATTQTRTVTLNF